MFPLFESICVINGKILNQEWHQTFVNPTKTRLGKGPWAFAFPASIGDDAGVPKAPPGAPLQNGYGPGRPDATRLEFDRTGLTISLYTLCSPNRLYIEHK